MGKSVSKLSKDELRSLKNATYFDKRELQQWYKGFLRDCPSGQLLEEEFVKVFKQFFPFGEPIDYCHFLFQAFDVDKSKFIDFKEFILALSITSRGSMEQKLAWSYRMYDFRRTERVDYKDMLQVNRAIYKMLGNMVTLPDDQNTPELRTKKLFLLLNKDPDHDTINLEEFKQLLMKDPNITNALHNYDGLV